MKELRLKIKRENYNLFKELGDKQAGELIKGMCAYMYDGKPFFTKDPYLKGAFMGIKKEIDEASQRQEERGSICGKTTQETDNGRDRCNYRRHTFRDRGDGQGYE